MSTTEGPSRRRVLRAGGLTVAFGALVAACSGEDDPAPAAPPQGEAPAAAPGSAASEVALVNTALSLEVLAFETYQVALDGALLQTGEVAESLALFQQHHAEHRAALASIVEGQGAEPFDTANPVMKVVLVNPALASVAAERDLVSLVRDIEQLCTQLAVHVASQLAGAAPRSAIMGIGATAGRRAAFLDRLGDLGSEQVARQPTSNPLPADAVVPD